MNDYAWLVAGGLLFVVLFYVAILGVALLDRPQGGKRTSEIRCENCDGGAAGFDPEGVPLCAECAADYVAWLEDFRTSGRAKADDTQPL